MIIVTLKQILDCEQSLLSLMEKRCFSFKTSLYLAGIVKQLASEVQTFRETYQKFVDVIKVEKLNDDGKPFSPPEFEIPQSEQEKFQKDLNDILSKKVAIEGEKIKLSEIEIIDKDAYFSPKELLNLEWLIEVDK